MRLSTLLLRTPRCIGFVVALVGSASPGCTGSADPAPAATEVAATEPPGSGDDANEGRAADNGSGDPDTPSAPAAPPCPEPTSTVTFATSDGVTLEADLLVPPDSQAVAILVHMIPPNFDRSSYPPRIREAIAALGYTVLTLDRRGAGGSAGDAVAAYEGDGGRLDLEAAVQFLASFPEACGIATDRLALIGASNGTTSTLDYLVGRSDALPAPTAIAWLSPGDYTENQHTVADAMEPLARTRLLIVHPSSEPWATQFADETPASWDLLELADGQHGTQNFDNGPLEARTLEALTGLLQQ